MSGADDESSRTRRSRRERNDCKWNSAVFPEFFTLNNASTSGRPHTTANPHGPPAAPTQLFSVFPLAGSRPLIACLRDHIYDAIVHCVLGEDDLYLVSSFLPDVFHPGAVVCPLDPAPKRAGCIFQNTCHCHPVTFSPTETPSIASSFCGGG